MKMVNAASYVRSIFSACVAFKNQYTDIEAIKECTEHVLHCWIVGFELFVKPLLLAVHLLVALQKVLLKHLLKSFQVTVEVLQR